ncbi:DUF2478 domain-containing protein [Ciceribacter thiooxidans]|uniref:DUF2478 domain-containing protein n=1 Tax=Ciceribacter thiooxidans TaxID=1969821 RepID=A0ABV7I9B4_9HYPH|nr:DUF2478 domain-containing protein [Ciceribacter thiooxidans]
MTDNAFPLQAAIHVQRDRPVDDILRATALALSADGQTVIGFLQWEGTGDGECCGEIALQDIGTGELITISQALGSGARGCRLDPQALAAVAGSLLARLDDDTDLLVLNRFGKGESEGQGFRAVIEEACIRGIPVLTVVRDEYLPAWEEFSGEFGCLLAPDRQNVLDWARRAGLAARSLRDAA